jgi:hypothetical protein
MVFLLICVVTIFTGSCRPEANLPVTDNYNRSYYAKNDSYREIAHTFWEGVNVNYVFWDIAPVKFWDDMRDEYLNEIGALGFSTKEKDPQFMDHLKKMTASLHDGHFTVRYNGRSFSPQEDRVTARFSGDDDANPKRIFMPNNPNNSNDTEYQNFANYLIIPKYLNEGGSSAQTQDGYLRIAQGKIAISPVEHITYFYFSEFPRFKTITSGDEEDVKKLLEKFWTDLYSPECKGIIFDVRGNSGGYNADIEYLICPLLTEKLHFANIRSKKSEGRLSYTPWIPYTIAPQNSIPNAGKIPVVVLINDYTISCAELLALAVKAMPNGYLIGTRTWGATGPRIGDDYPNALNDGSFTVRWFPEGLLQVVQAGYQTRGRNFENYESIGIEPDLYVPFSQLKFTNNGAYDEYGSDDQLQKAIDHIIK